MTTVEEKEEMMLREDKMMTVMTEEMKTKMVETIMTPN
jgi:hypothetical protein